MDPLLLPTAGGDVLSTIEFWIVLVVSLSCIFFRAAALSWRPFRFVVCVAGFLLGLFIICRFVYFVFRASA